MNKLVWKVIFYPHMLGPTKIHFTGQQPLAKAIAPTSESHEEVFFLLLFYSVTPPITPFKRFLNTWLKK